MQATDDVLLDRYQHPVPTSVPSRPSLLWAPGPGASGSCPRSQRGSSQNQRIRTRAPPWGVLIMVLLDQELLTELQSSKTRVLPAENVSPSSLPSAGSCSTASSGPWPPGLLKVQISASHQSPCDRATAVVPDLPSQIHGISRP